METLSTSQRRLLIALVFFVLPALAYIGLLTRFTFGLFDPTYGWQVYNYYALALADGRQSVPAEVVALEGLYIGGKVYMYYGMLPAVLRMPLMLFIDLRYIPVSNFIVAAMLITGQWAMQLAVLRIFIVNGRIAVFSDRCMLVFVSVAVWFMSGPFLVAQTANFYHEPLAASLMLAGVYTAMLSNDLLVKKRRPAGGRLLCYALIAGLSVYSRQTCAVGLYAITLALLLPNWSDLRAQPKQVLVSTIRRAAGPLILMFAFGIGFIAMSYFRTGEPGSGFRVENYGAYLLGDNIPRLRVMSENMFDIVRVGPNIFYMLFGNDELRENLICQLGGGMSATWGRPVRWIIFASLPLFAAFGGAACLARRIKGREPLTFLIASAAVGFLLIAMLVWAYVSAAYRYNAEVWPIIAWLMLIAMRDINPSAVFGRWMVPAAVVAVGLIAVSLVYSARLRPGMMEDTPRHRGSLRVGVPLAPELIAAATAPGARDPQVIIIRNAYGPDPALPPGWKPVPFTKLREKC